MGHDAMSMAQLLGRGRYYASVAKHSVLGGVSKVGDAVSSSIPSIRITNGGSVLKMVGVGALCFVVGYGWAWWTTGSWWREQLAAKSEKVRQAVSEQNDAIAIDDAKIIEALGYPDEDLAILEAAYREALARARRAEHAGAIDDPCRVPRSCVVPERVFEAGGP